MAKKVKKLPDVPERAAVLPVEPEKVTAAVTDPWAGLEIPEQFLRNEDNTWKHPPIPIPIPGADTTTSKASAPTPNVPTPAAEPPAGDDSGPSTRSMPSTLLDFDSLKVDPQEIESQIKREADRRFYQWDKPTKRPTKNAILKQVRKEFYK